MSSKHTDNVTLALALVLLILLALIFHGDGSATCLSYLPCQR